MKRKVFCGTLLWALCISLVHIQLNVGWSQLEHELAVLTGTERREVIVGFLPVT